MKNLLNVSFLLLFALFYGQNVSDYQYIYIPKEFADEKANKYGLNDLLQLKLKQKKFNIVTESKEKWPQDLAQDACKILTAELSDTSNMFRNRITIDFKDCQNKTIASIEGKSLIKEFETGMKDALEDAAKKITLSNPVQKPAVKKETKITPEPIQTQAADSDETNKKTKTTSADKAAVYSNGALNLNKILLSHGEFILVNPNNSVPYAIFKPSTKKDTYRVQLSDGTSTLGYLEEGKIIIERTNTDGSLRSEIFEETRN